MQSHSFLKTAVVFLLIVVMSFTQVLGFSLVAYAAEVELAEADNNPQSAYDLITVVIDKRLRDDGEDYVGLSGDFDDLREMNIDERAQRYAEDLIENNSFTDVKILYFDPEVDTVESLAAALENIYLNGDGAHKTWMTGVVLVGDVPLPVVNKNGNRFISMFPYTDFTDKAYILDPQLGEFLPNELVGFPSPEIWHGVIRANDNEDLATYFDKNHLYYLGQEKFREDGDYGEYAAYAQFDRKMFFGDLIHEEEQMQADVYGHYLDYLDAAEDISYMRFNKHWAAEFTESAAEELENLTEQLSDEYAPERNEFFDSEQSFVETLGEAGRDMGIPDVFSRTIIQQNLIPYYRVLNRYISSVNDWTEYTGRYALSEVQSVPELISVKDEAMRVYLRSVNDALEKKINQVAERIEEPLPLLQAVNLSGSFGENDDFRVEISNLEQEGETLPMNEQTLRFNYLNQQDDQFYINGVNVAELPVSEIDADRLMSAKICAPYLGSTKSEYFNQDVLAYDPKGVDGEYSILTRSLRSDNPATAYTDVTAGVNTRVVSVEELVGLTAGQFSGRYNAEGLRETGEVIEAIPELGIPAFIDNPVSGDGTYRGYFEREFQEGDLIVSVNGQGVSSDYDLERAVDEMYRRAVDFIDAMNDGEYEKLEGFEYNLATLGEVPAVDPPLEAEPQLQILNSEREILENPRLRRGLRVRAMGVILDLVYYRGGQRFEKQVSFSVSADDGDGADIRWPSKETPQGSRSDFKVVMFPDSMAFPNNFNWNAETNGAVMALYKNRNDGYGERPYDASSGCNYNSAGRSSDRCVGRLATIPVRDAGGSQAPQWVNIPGEGLVLEFPRNVKRTNLGANSERDVDWQNAVDYYAFPNNYDFEQVDDLYMDSCFGLPLPSYQWLAAGDSNPYQFPLDRGTKEAVTPTIPEDIYGLFMRSVGQFVESDLADESDYRNNGGPADSSDYNPREQLWQGITDLTAADIILHKPVGGADLVTLKNFTDRYGLIDGKDNDGDEIADYEWRDTDGDGEYETKFYDFDEASPEYALDADNLPEISRKLLSHASTFVIPYGLDSFPPELREFGEDIVLRVEPLPFEDKKISSLILHNEPTKHTIMEQLKAQATKDLPIDDPRYVAFLSEADPEESVSQVNPLAQFNVDSYHIPGEIQKVDYINLFDERVNNFAQLQVLLWEKANELAAIPGSYKIFGPNAGPEDYREDEIAEEILSQYLAPTVTSFIDDPLDGFDLKRASTQKLNDALQWKSFSIDDKHHYVLEYFLNGDNSRNTFVQDGANYPARLGSKAAYGYEASYLVLDGEEDYFEMSFNKDLREEDDRRFDPLGNFEAEEEDGQIGSAEEDDDFEFVWLDQFLEELEAFIDGFTSVPNFTQACGYNAAIDQALNGENNGVTSIERFELSVDKALISLRGDDQIDVTVKAYDADGNLVRRSGDLVNLNLEQGGDYFASSGNSQGVIDSNGELHFQVRANGIGQATLSASSESGAGSNAVQVSSTNKQLRVLSEEFLTADDESLLDIEVQIIGEDGGIENDQVHQVQMSVAGNMVEVIGDNVVETEQGVARFQVKAGRRSGEVELNFEVLEGVYPKAKEIVKLEAGEPVAIEVKSDSFVLVANGQSKTRLEIILKDKFGNVANNAFTQVAAFANGIASLDEAADINSNIVGTQLNTFEGRTYLDVYANDEVGQAHIILLLFDYDLEQKFIDVGGRWQEIDFANRIGATVNIDVVDKVDLELRVLDSELNPAQALEADGESLLRLAATMKYGDQVVKNYNGAISFEIVDESLGEFFGPVPFKMVDGQVPAPRVQEFAPAYLAFKSSVKAGEVEINVNVPGFVSDSVRFRTLAGEATKIELVPERESLNTKISDQMVIEAKLLDENGNLSGENRKRVEFGATAATAALADFDPSSSLSVNGEAATQMSSTGRSGTVNVVASAEGLEDALLSIDINKKLGANEIENFAPRSLYMSLLGGDFGDVLERDNMAQLLLFSGQVQAIASNTSVPNEAKKLLTVDGFGQVEILDSMVESKVVAANDQFDLHRVKFTNVLTAESLGTLFVKPKVDAELRLMSEDQKLDQLEEGIWVKTLSEGFEVEEAEGQIEFMREGENLLTVRENGKVDILDSRLQLRLPTASDQISSPYFTLVISEEVKPVAALIYKQDFGRDVGALVPNTVLERVQFPGIYFRRDIEESGFEVTKSFTKNSSAFSKGLALVDKNQELPSEQAPGFGYDSLEKAAEVFGLGFEGDNKHMLYFSAGNSVGESHLPYASESGIIYGDPTIRLAMEEDLVSMDTGYSKDIGRALLNGTSTVEEIIDFDINSDGEDDLLVVYENGSIHLLENIVSQGRFMDRGEVLRVFGDVLSATKIDINNDGYDDLIVGTEDSCLEGEECISLYRNIGGGFERESLDIDLGGDKSYVMRAADLNLDHCEDLVLSTSDGDVMIFHNQILNDACIGLEAEASEEWEFGYKLDQEINQAEDIFLYYPGVADIAGEVLEFTLRFGEGEEKFKFLNLAADQKLRVNTVKQAIDVNGDSVGAGDRVNYLITLRNDSAQNISEMMLSDVTPTSMSLDLESLQCLDANCEDDLQWRATGNSLRSHIIENISVPAGGRRTIKYTMTVDSMPEIGIEIGNGLTDYPDHDDHPALDVMVRPSFNPTGMISYLYSVGFDDQGRAEHERYYRLPELENNGYNSDLSEDLLTSPDDADTAPAAVQKQIEDLQRQQIRDSDNDGLADMWNDVLDNGENSLDAVGDKIESAIADLRCNGAGCLPIPYNKAFLAPDGATPGWAALAFGTASLPYFGIFYPSNAPSSSRIYLSPTLTGGLGTSLCIGPGGPAHSGACYAVAVPGGIPGSSGFCDALLGGVEDAISTSKNSTIDPATGQAAVISDGQGAGGQSFGANLGDDENSPFNAAAQVNIKIPGFPAVITNWLDNQMDEIYNKLLDFPKFYLILPDIVPFVTENVSATGDVSFQSFHDFASTVAAIPLINIEAKEVVVRVPAVSRKEVDKYKQQWERWKADMQKQLDEKIAFWNCEESEEKRGVCDAITADVNQFINSVNQLLELVDQLANLPREILNYRQLETKYASQVVCYLDAVTDFTGGYIKKQGVIVESWMKAVEDAIKTFKDWQVVLDLAVDYQASCDQCKNDRFSKLGLLLSVFAAIPEPPIIPLPKWPDLVVDLSNVRTGVNIVWPDVVFKPEYIKLPNLPELQLPDILPNVRIEIPGFEVPELPQFVLPQLPDLPPLPLPQLPDLPRPPRIPKLPNAVVELVANLKPIFRILCLLKNGLIPVPEAGLATEIETLTQPNINVVLPIIKKLGVQYPPIQYDFVREIQINAKTNMGINTDFVYLKTKKALDEWNENVKALADNLNQYTTFPYGQILSNIVQNWIDQQVQEGIDELPDTDIPGPVDVEISAPSSYEDFDRIADSLGIDLGNLETINEQLEEYIATLETYPDSYELVASEILLDQSDPLLNRSLAQLEADIRNETLIDDPAVQRVAQLRNTLFDYAQNLEQSNALLEDADDLEQFTKILVDNDQSLSRIASNGPSVGAERPGTLEYSFLGEEVEEALTNVAGEARRELLALNPSELGIDLPGGNSAVEMPVQPIGFYVAGDNGVNENVLNYTVELKKKTNVLFKDVDKDGDTDIIYSSGGDVYLKENHRQSDRRLNREGDLIDTKTRISDWLNKGGVAVQGLRSSFENHQKVGLSWLAAPGDILGYELILRNSIYEPLRQRQSSLRFLALNYALESEETAEFLDLIEVEMPENEQEARLFLELDNPDQPSVELEVENGNYYVEIRAINSEGESSLRSHHAVATPSACNDQEAPFPAVTDSNFSIPIFSELRIDASGSFDADGEIVSYYLETVPMEAGPGVVVTELPREIWSDLNPAIDSDGDGNAENDRSNPVFTVGPFTEEGDIGERTMILHVVDQSGRSSEMELSVNVFVPEISLDETFGRTSIARGEVSPNLAEIPFSLMRERYIYRVQDGSLKLVPHTEVVAEGVTDANGRYEISDFELEDLIEVENFEGVKVAEINPKTGNIEILLDGYGVEVREARVPESGTRLEIVGPSGEVLGAVYAVADENTDVQVHEELGINRDNFEKMEGVNIDDRDAEDAYEVISLPANDPGNPGGVIIFDREKGENIVSLDTAGNIILISEAVSLNHKENDYREDPLLIEVIVEGKVIAEIYIGRKGALYGDSAQILDAANVPYSTPRTPSAISLYGASRYVNGAYEDIVNSLDFDEGEEFRPEDLVERAEFVRVLLNLLCIIPREPEAYQNYAAGSGYFDVNFDPEGDHPYIKEATLLGLVEGYKGEQEADGRTPFRPSASITRAEAVKVILEALELKGVIDISTVEEGEPWYDNYILAAQNLSPYFIGEALPANNFIITAEEADNPGEQMTFDQLLLMVQRVLTFYSCAEVDEDGDGMSDFCELKYDVDVSNEDADNDGLTNAQECIFGLNPRDADDLDDDNDGLTTKAEIFIYKTDPYDADTDDGGVNDGDEVDNFTDPLFGGDDSGDDSGDSGVQAVKSGLEGLYIAPAECNTCPCISTFKSSSDIMAGDVFFPVISKEYAEPAARLHIFTKGNEVRINSVNQ